MGPVLSLRATKTETHETEENKEKLADKELEIKEERLKGLKKEKSAFCYLCFLSTIKTPVIPYNTAAHVCFTCEYYLCKGCFKQHNSSHTLVNKDAGIWEILEKKRTTDIKKMTRELMGEKDRRKKITGKEPECLYDRVFVKHPLDQRDCNITGICEMIDKKWAVCDSANSCIKIFQFGYNALLRYIRIGSEPFSVKEVKGKQPVTVPQVMPSTNSAIQNEPCIHCFIAVTLPWKRHILFIDVNENPATKVKEISFEKECWSLDVCNNKLFVVCDEKPGSGEPVWSVHVLSVTGNKLYVIQTGIHLHTPFIAVSPGKIYLSDYQNDKVKCINRFDRVITEIPVSKPEGISVDRDCNVYICTKWPLNIYKFDIDLGGRQALLHKTKEYMEFLKALCFNRDMLFVSHVTWSPLRNFVSIIHPDLPP